MMPDIEHGYGVRLDKGTIDKVSLFSYIDKHYENVLYNGYFSDKDIAHFNAAIKRYDEDGIYKTYQQSFGSDSTSGPGGLIVGALDGDMHNVIYSMHDDINNFDVVGVSSVDQLPWEKPNQIETSMSREILINTILPLLDELYGPGVYSRSDFDRKDLIYNDPHPNKTIDRKICDLAGLKNDWDGCGAREISMKAIENALAISYLIPISYIVFPTKSGGVGFKSERGTYPVLAIEVSPNRGIFGHYGLYDNQFYHEGPMSTRTLSYLIDKTLGR